jgi:RNA polymerase sigma-70 factor (ECF subfamily)
MMPGDRNDQYRRNVRRGSAFCGDRARFRAEDRAAGAGRISAQRPRDLRGAHAVASQAATFSRLGLSNQLVLVNGNLGFVSRRGDGRLFAVLGFTIADGSIVEMDILADPERLSRLDLSSIDG